MAGRAIGYAEHRPGGGKGNSMGGWLALHFATAYPQRTSALVLLAPSGIIPPKGSFLDRTAGIAGDMENARAVNDLVLGDEAIPKEVREFMNLTWLRCMV